ncbi:MAG TPA: CopG family transcriptional regulator [Herpetosiphonaceae bacterium]
MADIEKLSFNISVVDLGQIDLLVDQGFYSSRTDFLRAAIRTQIGGHAETIKQTVTRKSGVLGVTHLGRANLERRQAAGEILDVTAVGMLVIGDDVTAELARATIASISIYGVFRASPAVKAALADRMR